MLAHQDRIDGRRFLVSVGTLSNASLEERVKIPEERALNVEDFEHVPRLHGAHFAAARAPRSSTWPCARGPACGPAPEPTAEDLEAARDAFRFVVLHEMLSDARAGGCGDGSPVAFVVLDFILEDVFGELTTDILEEQHVKMGILRGDPGASLRAGCPSLVHVEGEDDEIQRALRGVQARQANGALEDGFVVVDLAEGVELLRLVA